MLNQSEPRRVPPPVDTQEFARLPSKRDHEVETYEVLLRLYTKRRIESQMRFYDTRFKEFDLNSGFMVFLSAAVMGLSTILSVGAQGYKSPFLAFCTAILPAFAALLASLRQLYQWDKQSKLYKDASLGLQEALLIMPDRDIFDSRTANLVLPRLVKASEDVFMSEINQWGQIALGLDDKDGDDELNKRLRELEIQDRITGSIGGGGIPIDHTPTPTPNLLPPQEDDGGVG